MVENGGAVEDPNKDGANAIPVSAAAASDDASSNSGVAVEGVPDLSGQVVGGRYRVLKPLAKGGMSRVFLAEQIGMKRRVVLKFLRPPLDDPEAHSEWTKRFAREVEAIATLSHPNIIVAHEYSTTESGLAYVVMEYAEGATLSEYVRATGGLPPSEAIWIALQIASALDEAHHKGIIHRDLKPQNVIVQRGRTTRVKVLDFGLAKSVNESDLEGADVTGVGIRLGSPRYMSPEQVNGESASFGTDIYALGCVLYFTVVGKPPFVAADSIAVMVAHVNSPPPAVRDAKPGAVSEEFEAVIQCCLRKRPSERYASMEELAAALRACPEAAGAGPITGSPSMSGQLAAGEIDAASRSSRSDRTGTTPMVSETQGVTPEPAPWYASRPVAIGAVGVACVVLLLVSWSVLRGGATEDPRPNVEPIAIRTSAAEPSSVDVELTSTPAGASVRRDGSVVGQTPFTMAVRQGASVSVVLSLEGYQDAPAQLSADVRHPQIRLTRLPSASPVVTSTPTTPATARRPGRPIVSDTAPPIPTTTTVAAAPLEPTSPPAQASPPSTTPTHAESIDTLSDNLDPWGD